jgi:hypothetical protein
LLIALVVVAGIAIGALAYVVFGDRDKTSPTASPQTTTVFPATQPSQTSTVQTPYSTTSAAPPPCPYAPQVQKTGISMTQSGLVVSTTVSMSCDSVDVLSGAGVQVMVSSGTRDIASGFFDLTSHPIVISPGGQVQQQFIFPAGMYWRIPELVANDVVSVEISNYTRSLTSAASSPSGTPLTAVLPAAPGHGSLEGTARNGLDELATYDRPWVQRYLQNQWVPQISSKKVGLVADGITYDNSAILRDHVKLRQEYSGVRLVRSDDWTTFASPGWWITVVSQPYPLPDMANRWCDSQGIDADNCFAKMISSIYGPPGTTVLRK